MEQELIITTETGEKVTISVIDIFTLDEYPNKEYVAYTKNEIVNDEVKVYISILDEHENEFNLLEIEDPRELELAQEEFNNSIYEENVGQEFNGLALTAEQIKELAKTIKENFPDLVDVKTTIFRVEKYVRELMNYASNRELLANYTDYEIEDKYSEIVEKCIMDYLTYADDPNGYISTIIFITVARNVISYVFELENLTEIDNIAKDVIVNTYTELSDVKTQQQAEMECPTVFARHSCKPKKEYPELYKNPVVIVKKRKYDQQ